MKNKNITMILILASLLTLAIPIVSAGPPAGVVLPPTAKIPGHLQQGTEGYIYVYGQDKYYLTIVPITPNEGLPPNGPFQLVEPTLTDALFETEFGPGDPGYVGGRWYDPSGPAWFLCPLIGPALDSIP
jgi:hypothetical protein